MFAYELRAGERAAACRSSAEAAELGFTLRPAGRADADRGARGPSRPGSAPSSSGWPLGGEGGRVGRGTSGDDRRHLRRRRSGRWPTPSSQATRRRRSGSPSGAARRQGEALPRIIYSGRTPARQALRRAAAGLEAGRSPKDVASAASRCTPTRRSARRQGAWPGRRTVIGRDPRRGADLEVAWPRRRRLRGARRARRAHGCLRSRRAGARRPRGEAPRRRAPSCERRCCGASGAVLRPVRSRDERLVLGLDRVSASPPSTALSRRREVAELDRAREARGSRAARVAARPDRLLRGRCRPSDARRRARRAALRIAPCRPPCDSPRSEAGSARKPRRQPTRGRGRFAAPPTSARGARVRSG